MALASTKKLASSSTPSYEMVDGIPTYKLFIDGQWVDSSTKEVTNDVNPATGEIFARVQQAGDAEIEQAIAAAYRANSTWGSSLVAEREELLLRTARVIEARFPEIRDSLI